MYIPFCEVFLSSYITNSFKSISMNTFGKLMKGYFRSSDETVVLGQKRLTATT